MSTNEDGSDRGLDPRRFLPSNKRGRGRGRGIPASVPQPTSLSPPVAGCGRVLNCPDFKCLLTAPAPQDLVAKQNYLVPGTEEKIWYNGAITLPDKTTYWYDGPWQPAGDDIYMDDLAEDGVKHTMMHNSIKKQDFERMQNIISFAPGCVNAVCPCGVSHFATAVLTGNVRIVNLMISSKADVNASGHTDALNLEGKTEDAASPLHIACVTTRYDMAKALVEAGADVNARCALDESTPMHTNACLNVANDKTMADGKNLFVESSRIQTLLLSARANIDAQNKIGQTPLHVAIRHGVTTMQCFLIRNGADLNVFDNEKRNALIYAVSHGSSSTTGMLLANRCGLPPYHVPLVCRAASRNGWSIVLQLLRNGANINETDEQGNNAIHYALTAVEGTDNCCRETHIIDKLIKRGCNPCLANKAGMTPLGVVTTPGVNYQPSHAEYILLEYVIDSMYRFVYGSTPASAKEMAALMNTSWRYEDVELLFKIKSGLPSYTRTADESLLSDLHGIRNALVSDKNAKELLGCEPPTKNAKQRRIERKAGELRWFAARVVYLQAVFRRSLTPSFAHRKSKECTMCFALCNTAAMPLLAPCGHRSVCDECLPLINMVCMTCNQRVLCVVRKIYD